MSSGFALVSNVHTEHEMGMRPFDFERRVFVDNAISFSKAFVNNEATTDLFNQLAAVDAFNRLAAGQRKVVAFKFSKGMVLSPDQTVHTISHIQHMAVLGYLYLPRDVPRKIARKCQTVTPCALMKLRLDWTGNFAKKPEDVPGKLNDFFRNTPGYKIAAHGFLLRNPLSRPDV